MSCSWTEVLGGWSSEVLSSAEGEDGILHLLIYVETCLDHRSQII